MWPVAIYYMIAKITSGTQQCFVTLMCLECSKIYRPFLETVMEFWIDAISREPDTNNFTWSCQYSAVIMGAIVSQIASLTIVYSTVYSGADQRKYQSSASLAFVRGIHRWPVNSLHKRPVTRKMFHFDDVIMVTISRESHFCIIVCAERRMPVGATSPGLLLLTWINFNTSMNK